MNDARVWDPVRSAFGGERKAVVVETHASESLTAIAAEAVRAMPGGPFAVAGFSLGGYVAMEVCRQAHARVAGIALLDTGARADEAAASDSRRRMIAALGQDGAGFAEVARAFVPRVVHPAHAQDDELFALLEDMARRVGRDGFVRQQTAALGRPDSRALLATLRCPSLVLCGREDRISPPALSEEMAALLGGDTEHVTVVDCGHMSTLEQPAVVGEALGRWLRRVDAAAGVERP